MLALKLGFTRFARRRWGLALTLVPAAILFGMLTFTIAAEQSLGELRAARVIQRSIRLGKAGGYDTSTAGFTEAEVARIGRTPGISVGPAYFFVCGVDDNHVTELTCGAANPTYLRIHDYTIRITDADMARWEAQRDGIVVSRFVADQHHWKVGDHITLRDREKHEYPLTVSCIAESGLELTSMYIHIDYYEQLRGTAKFWVLWLLADDATQRDALMDRIDADLESIRRPHTIWRGEATLVLLMSTSNTLVWAIQAAGLFALLLVVCVSVTLLVLAFEERVVELATMNVLGFRRGVLALSVIVEAELIVAGSALLGAIATFIVFHGHALTLDVVVTVQVKAMLVPIVVLGGMVLGLLTALPAVLRVARLDALEALRS